ncbi:MAG: hypothetical protein IJW82_02475 [Clostridia bacterium]|nr:hypothetical protein [Clostridia bacterium]
MTKEELILKFDLLQIKFGSKNCNAVYGGGYEKEPNICMVFMNPTARNIATKKGWQGIRCQWLGTKQVWNFLAKCGLFSEELNNEIQNKKPNEWTPGFCELVYKEVENNSLYITNLAKCTQDDARVLKDDVFKNYLDLLIKEIDLVKPKKIILFGNQVSSIVLNQKISVSTSRKQVFKLTTNENIIDTFSVYYPVGNGFFNIDKAIEDTKFVINYQK